MPITADYPKHRTMYTELIERACAGGPHAAACPHLVEAWMRLERGTLDGLSAAEFASLARECAAVVIEAPEESVQLAQSIL